jgi:pimeloyl-ACP methyl ester carboxylesterase
VPRLLIAAASGLTLAVAAGISATRDAPASTPQLGPPAKVQSFKCPQEAVDIAKAVECGDVRLPLDREKPAGKQIGIYFELYPRTDRARPALSTVLSIEGGPGYPTSADRGGRADLWYPVSERRDLLLVDLRGTGESGALGCKAFAKSTSGYKERAGQCAQQIGPERDLYSTSQAVQDLEEVLRALDAGKIDLYGDS